MNNRLNDTRFSALRIGEECKTKALLSIISDDQGSGVNHEDFDELLFALFANINKDLVNYKEAM